ncbi:MAG TPA: DUF4198 domain-containing protein [Vicinamibacterales bacterium]|nr:DUF4198 domain-containing protein [Vicinamibacterales bacterium]
MNRLASLSNRTVSVLVVAAIATSGATLSAHDMWVEPTTFAPAAGEIVGVRLRVGQDLLGDPIPRDPALLRQFIVDDSEGRKPVVGRDGLDPAGYVRAATAGLLVVGYHSHPSSVELPAEKFNQYLKEEGLDAIAALRAARGQSGAVGKETFTRCAKSLLLSGPAGASQRDHALGFTLELVAERNPYALAAQQDLPVRLTYEGRPLAGALVVAINQSRPSERQAVRSDKAGRARFRVSDSGMWLIKAVHMIDAPPGSTADWASYWASLTFALHAPAPQRQAS